MVFNPFNKKIREELTIDDLDSLIRLAVVEGFYVEYKSGFPSSEKIARSIASFANTYGGWYFIGIEADKSRNVATNLCGFDHTQHTDPVAKVRDPARLQLSHMPLMFPQVIQLDGSRSVIAIYIPESEEPPHITKDGRIYRRAADASDPMPEKDRYAIDRLVDKGRQERQRFWNFCQDDRSFSKGESELGWISLYLQPRPANSIDIPVIESAEGINTLIERSQAPISIKPRNIDFQASATMPFTTGYSTNRSVVLRRTYAGQLLNNTMSLELFYNGSMRLHVPMYPVDYEQFVTGIPKMSNEPKLNTQTIIDYIRRLINDDRDAMYLKYIDLGMVTWFCVFMMAFYFNWLEEFGQPQEFWANIQLDNVFRVVPIVDSEYWLAAVKSTGLPISFRNSISVPPRNDHPLVFRFDDRDLLWFWLLKDIGSGLGVPASEFGQAVLDALFRLANKPE